MDTLLVWREGFDVIRLFLIPAQMAEKVSLLLGLAHNTYLGTDENEGLYYLEAAIYGQGRPGYVEKYGSELADYEVYFVEGWIENVTVGRVLVSGAL